MAFLVYIAEHSQNASFQLGKGTLLIGSRNDAGLQLPSTEVSSEHASILFDNGQYYVHDLGSAAGTYLNGERVTQSQLKHNDIIRFGEYRFRVDLLDSGSIAPATNPSKAPTSRLDVPEGASFPKRFIGGTLQRKTGALPRERRVVETRPQSLKSAETSQIEPVSTSSISLARKTSSLSEAIIKRKEEGDAEPTSEPAKSKVTARTPVAKASKKLIPQWVWFLLDAVLASAITVIVMHFFAR